MCSIGKSSTKSIHFHHFPGGAMIPGEMNGVVRGSTSFVYDLKNDFCWFIGDPLEFIIYTMNTRPPPSINSTIFVLLKILMSYNKFILIFLLYYLINLNHCAYIWTFFQKSFPNIKINQNNLRRFRTNLILILHPLEKRHTFQYRADTSAKQNL